MCSECELVGTHLLTERKNLGSEDWKDVRSQLPEPWMWDVDYHSIPNMSGEHRGCWTCSPMGSDDPKDFPLTIAGAPVVIPVEYRWPLAAGVNPPPDPRPSAPINCAAELRLEVIRDIFLTFEGSIGFYLLVNGLIQIIVPEEFDIEWASSHLPHKYGGLRICYIPQSMTPTMVTSETETMQSETSQSSGLSSARRLFRPSSTSFTQALHLNDFIEAHTKSTLKEGKFAGRIGLRTSKCGNPYILMSTHVITEAILAKSHHLSIFNRRRNAYENLERDWNECVEIWAGNEKIGTVDKSFDANAGVFPNGFMHDITLIKPTIPAAVKDIKSPISDIRWLSREAWSDLRRRTSAVKILGDTENRAAKTLKTNCASEVLVIGEGVFLNQPASSKPAREHDIGTWKGLVSRSLLYRVHRDFDPPNGYSGIALYADGLREDGTTGPGIVGFQSFVQRSGHVQNFDMEGSALNTRLKLGRVAFYGAFQVPDELRREHVIA
ncbi:uncharacterized protein BDR25DRAFT_289612 [Lindgomyces ingoldianus]|uniref:Uncharacterized protein n=1 Tax=Lindgomyces ingoldianus TaxID=673940 RepID=A0ACB6QR34_9PLEO|nr:uncharacterized protein BDR25DRAFT_289612 [Lindgomyces ingoldianus]KAF2468747.1 hypothetical protein BDR25DRAFT_289612 [Lindgomyces ingoldianus]